MNKIDIKKLDYRHKGELKMSECTPMSQSLKSFITENKIMFEVKNSIDWETFKIKIHDRDVDLYFDNEDYFRLLCFDSDDKSLSDTLDVMFGGYWCLFDSKDFEEIEKHYTAVATSEDTSVVKPEYTHFKEVPDIKVKIMTTKMDDCKKVINPYQVKDLRDVTLQYDPDLVKFIKGLDPSYPENTSFSVKLSRFQSSLYDLLVAKNKAYGNSALQPINTFSKASSSDVILQQIDHKLSRIKNSETPLKNDVIDLMGYLTLYCIDQDWVDLQDLHN